MKCPSCSKWLNPVQAFELCVSNKKFVCPNCNSLSERDRARDSINVALSMLVWGLAQLRHIDFLGSPELSGVIMAFGAFILFDNIFGRFVLICKVPTKVTE